MQPHHEPLLHRVQQHGAVQWWLLLGRHRRQLRRGHGDGAMRLNGGGLCELRERFNRTHVHRWGV